MNPAFDAYHLWLGIPPDEQPPNHYRLLGLRDRESDVEVIDIAALRLSAHVRGFLKGPHGETAKRLLAEMAAAGACLLDPARKAAYDATLRQQPPAEEARNHWPVPESPAESNPYAAPLSIDTKRAEQGASAAAPRLRRESGTLQFAKIIGGGAIGLALGDLVIYLLTGTDMFGLLPGKTRLANPPPATASRPEPPQSLPPQKIGPDKKSISTVETNLQPKPHVESLSPTATPEDAEKFFDRPGPLIAKLVPQPSAPPSPPTRAVPDPVQIDVLSGIPSAWQLPHLLSPDAQTVVTLARTPDEPLVLTLKCAAARLAAGTAISLAAEPDGRSWSIIHETPSPPSTAALAVLRVTGAELSLTWNISAPAEIRGQVQNCLLEIRHSTSTRYAQLRPVYQAGQHLLDLSDDKQLVEFALPDLPRLDKLRIEIRELVGFPEGLELPTEARSLLIGKQAILPLSKDSGGGIRVRFPFTSASAPSIAMRTEAIFRESARLEFDLSFPAVDKFVSSIDRELQKDQATLAGAQRALAMAQSELKRQQANQPTSNSEIAAKQLALRNAKSAISSATNRIGSLNEQIVLNQKRQAAVPTIRALLDSLHRRAAIRYVILAESGERDLLLVDGTASTVSAD